MTSSGIRYERLMAAATIVVVPMIILFIFCRKSIVTGVARRPEGVSGLWRLCWTSSAMQIFSGRLRKTPDSPGIAAFAAEVERLAPKNPGGTLCSAPGMSFRPTYGAASPLWAP